MARRILRLSKTLNRTLSGLGVIRPSPRHGALGAAVVALVDAVDLPGPADFETTFAPGYVHVRRVSGFNLWILYRFDATFLDVMSVRDTPPTPVDRG